MNVYNFVCDIYIVVLYTIQFYWLKKQNLL